MSEKKYLAICGRKGGSGKTALALSLAAYYLNAKKPVLVIDLDPQGSASLAMGAEATGGDLAAAIEGSADKLKMVTIGDCLQFAPGGPALDKIDIVSNLRDIIPDDCGAARVIIDCPPGHAALDRLAIKAADYVLICTEAHRLGIAGAARVLDDARAHSVQCAVILSRMDTRRGLDKSAPELLAGAFPVPIMTVNQDSILAGSLNAGKLPPTFGRAADDVGAIARWIEGGKK
jgi:cellulose biosynthesis protein BcsQ